MVMWIAVAVTVVIAVIWLRSASKSYGLGWDNVSAILTVSALVGVAAFFIGGLIAVSSYGVGDALDWKLVSEDTYTIAEDSKVAVVNYTMEFIENTDGELRNHTEDFDKIDYVFADSDTVVVQKYHAELGSLIFPWGLGQDRTVITVR